MVLTSISLRLPFPPSVNKAYVTTRAGRRILSAEGKEYKRVVASTVATYCANRPDAVFDVTPLVLTIHLHMVTENKGWSKGTAKSRYKKVDASNRVKLLEDALFSCIGVDDSLVFDLHVHKISLNDEEPYALVTLSEKEKESI